MVLTDGRASSRRLGDQLLRAGSASCSHQDDARLQGYDEAEFARTLHYDRPIETSLSVFEAVRASSGELLERLDEDDWGRTGTHSESGRYSVEDWLAIYADHAEAHADQITRARAGA